MSKQTGWRIAILTSLALLGSVGSERTLAAEKASGCWGCQQGGPGGFLQCGEMTPGYWNCWEVSGGCGYASWGCGCCALVPTDADGSAQAVTLAADVPAKQEQDMPSALDHRPCDGVIVARRMANDEARGIQATTSILTL